MQASFFNLDINIYSSIFGDQVPEIGINDCQALPLPFKRNYYTMKKQSFLLVFLLLASYSVFAQTTIWSEDFESYADNSTTAVDNNTSDVGVDWTAQNMGSTGSSFQVEAEAQINGARVFRARNTGQGVSKTWLSESIDISGYENISISILYSEVGGMDPEDTLRMQYRLDGGNWINLDNGLQIDDMLVAIDTATGSIIAGCALQLRVVANTNANGEYWYFDDILVEGTVTANNSCLESTAISLSETSAGQTSNYTFTQTIPLDIRNLDVTAGNSITIVMAGGDLSSAATGGSSLDGVAIASFTTQTTDSLVFNAPTTVAENSSFDLIIAGITNASQEDLYNAQVFMTNNEGGLNAFNFSFNVGPSEIWYEDFETYADNTTTAVDNNTSEPGVDWTIEANGSTGTSFRVENFYMIEGNRGMLARNTGQGISKSWQSESIDISSYENVRVEMSFFEFGTMEASDSIVIEYRLDNGVWQRMNNGFHSGEMVFPEIARSSGLLGCQLDLRATMNCDNNNEYWTIDEVRVSAESVSDFSCFSSASLALSETGQSQTSTYTFTQTIPLDGGLNFDISATNQVIIVIPDADLSAATTVGSSFNGSAIAAFTTQNSDTLIFSAPITANENAAFDIVIAGISNSSSEGSYNASVIATNDEGGLNHYNYAYTVGPSQIWFEDFESYADNATVAVDNNSNDVGVDWTIEANGLTGTSFRVENFYMIDGDRGMVARNTGEGITKSWQTEIIDISAYDNVLIEVEYWEIGTMDPEDSIRIEYRLDGGAWVTLNNGFQADDMGGPETASASGLLGCQLEIRASMNCNNNNEYWSIDNILVASEDATGNSCFESTSLSISETNINASSTFTFTQTISTDVGLSLDISAANQVIIAVPGGDLSSATTVGSTFNGVAIASFTTQTTDTLIFNAPTGVAENVAFDIVIAGITNPGTEGEYNAAVVATNDEGGLNHYNYSFVVGPNQIWFEDFESYADNATVAVDNNTNDVGVDWTIEENGLTGTSFRVENFYMIDGDRGLVARNTGPGITKSWQTEIIDISAYDNVLIKVDYWEIGTMDPEDSIRIEYRLDGGAWVTLNNGFQADDMSGPETASVSGLLGCQLEIRTSMNCNNNNEYWSVDNVLVASEGAPENACFESASLAISESNVGASSDFTFTQTIPIDGGLSLDISTSNQIRILVPGGDLSSATTVGSTFNGVAIASFTTQTSDTLIFNAPTGVAENVSFDIVIAGITNPSNEAEYNASIEAINDEGGINHYNYSFTVGPSQIWFEDFETYADNATVAVDNNTNDVGVDWTIEANGLTGTSFRVENFYMIDGDRGLVARNTGPGITKSWQSEVIDISPYDNVLINIEYFEVGTAEASDSIRLEYRLDGGAWVTLNNGFHSGEMSAPEDASISGLLGCQLEIRISMNNDNNNEYWSVDNILVASEGAPENACFETASLAISETNVGATSEFTFTQTIPVDGGLSLDISATNQITIVLPGGDLSSATTGGSTFNGAAITSFTSQTSDTLIFNAPTSVAENVAFDIVIAGITNPSAEAEYNAMVLAVNDEGGINHYNYSFTVGPDQIWFEDFETYADNATVAVDNNTNDLGVDWTIEANGSTGTSFRVENFYMIDGDRGLVARNTGPGITKSWQTEIIDISAYDNVLINIEYFEIGTAEASDSIRLEYRLDGGAWVTLNNGFHSGEMSTPEDASASGLLGCQLEIRVSMNNNNNNEYWTIDNVLVASEGAPENACFESTSLTLSETNVGVASDYTFTQTIPVDGALNLDISASNPVTIVIPGSDLSSATTGGSTFNGAAIASFTTQTSDTLIFNAPASVGENVSFEIVIAGITNASQDGEYNASVYATNDEGGIDHYNYLFDVGPSRIWFEDFETYADNAGTAVDNNTNDVGPDWSIESGAGTSFRVENFYQIDGSRGMVGRNVSTERAWKTEAIDISDFNNVKLELDFFEIGTMEGDDQITIQYRLDSSSWENFDVNGFQSGEMSNPLTARTTGLLGCFVELRTRVVSNNNNEYWTVDNVEVSSESTPNNSCFENTSLSLSDDSPSSTSSFTYTQNIENDASKTLEIGIGDNILITLPEGDFSTATLAGSTFNGVAIASFSTQNSDTLIFPAPVAMAEGVTFDIVIANVTNPAAEGLSSSQIIASNAGGGLNHFVYQVSISPVNIYARLDGSWSDGSTWSTTGVGSETCDCLPGNSSIVEIDGYDIEASTTDIIASEITIHNDARNDDASLTISNNVALTVNGDINLGLDDAGENTSLIVQGNTTSINVGGDIVMSTTDGDDLSLYIDDNSQINVTGDFNGSHIGGDEFRIYINTISGTGGSLNVTGNMSLSQTGGDDTFITLEEDGTIDIGGNANFSLSGGDDFYIRLGNLSVDNTTNLNVGGNLTLDHNGAAAGDEMFLILIDSGHVTANGDFIVDTDFNSADILRAIANDNSIIEADGNVQFNAIADNESEIELNDNAELRIGGDFVRTGGFGLLDANDNSFLVFDGSAGTQEMPLSSGTGTDEIQYLNVRINNTFGTGPQLTTAGNISIPGTLSLTDGVIQTGSDTIIITSTSITAIADYSNASFVNGNLRRNILVNTDTIPFPVGTGGSATDYQLAEFLNNNLTGPSALNVNVATINEIGDNVDSNLDPSIAKDGPDIVNIFEDAEWDINPIGAVTGGDYGLRLYVQNLTGLSAALDDAFTILKRPSTSTNYNEWDALAASTVAPPLGSAGRIYDGGNGFAERTGYTSFSKFAVGASAGAPLPVVLLHFNAQLLNEEVLLSWATASEENSDYFILQKSQDTENWLSFAEISAKGGQNKYTEYSKIDDQPYSGISYYRLIEVDKSGKMNHAQIVSIQIDSHSKESLSLYPNPTSSYLNFNLESEDESLIYFIYDNKGILIGSGEINKNEALDLRDFQSGIYTLRIQTSNSYFIQKVVKD